MPHALITRTEEAEEVILAMVVAAAASNAG